MPYFKISKKAFISGFILTFLGIICDLIPPLVNGEIVRILKSGQNYYLIAVYVVLIIILIFLTCFIKYFAEIMLQKGGQKVVYQLRVELFSHLEGLPISTLSEYKVGQLTSKITNDTNTLSELFTTVFVNMLKHIITITLVLIIMVILNVKLALIILLIIPLLLLIAILFRHFSQKAYLQIRSSVSQMNAFLSESISGIKITQIFNQEDKIYQNFKEKNKKLLKNNYQEITSIAIFRPLVYFCFILAEGIILYFGAKDALNPLIPFAVADLVIFYSYIDVLFNPLQLLVDQYNTFIASMAGAKNVFAMLDIKDNSIKNGTKVLENFRGEIEFRGVWFAYNEPNWILKDVSFKIDSKQTVAFVGSTGAGKTTILALIVRNYDIQKGEILLDGVNIYEYDINSLRQNIGQMLQDVFLFSDTIYNNIVMGNDEITKEEVIEIASYVNAHQFISALDNSYDYLLTERGQNFSQGEKQLISFARTLCFKPGLIILDEATSNIDRKTELLIQNSLTKIKSIQTMIIVAHRLSTICNADKIFFLSEGIIVEEGNHEELLAKKGRYYQLFSLQK